MPRTEASLPERFVGIDVAQPGDLRLVQQKKFDRAPGSSEQLTQSGGRELAGKRVEAECADAGGVLGPGEPVHAAEVARVHKAQRAAAELESHVGVPRYLRRIEPEQLAVEPEVHGDVSTGEAKQQVFAAALDVFDALAFDAPAERG